MAASKALGDRMQNDAMTISLSRSVHRCQSDDVIDSDVVGHQVFASVKEIITDADLDWTGATALSKPVFVQLRLQNEEVQENSRAQHMCIVSEEPKPESSGIVANIYVHAHSAYI